MVLEANETAHGPHYLLGMHTYLEAGIVTGANVQVLAGGPVHKVELLGVRKRRAARGRRGLRRERTMNGILCTVVTRDRQLWGSVVF
jgi:hypothetical protein